MAGLGEFYSVSDQQLKAAFDSARNEGAEFLLKTGYSSSGGPFGIKGSGHFIELIDFHEDTFSTTRATMASDIRGYLEQHKDAQLKSVYTTEATFDKAELNGAVFESIERRFIAIRDNVAAEDYQKRMAARPFLWRLFGIGLER